VGTRVVEDDIVDIEDREEFVANEIVEYSLGSWAAA
jgi:hypothetical protein